MLGMIVGLLLSIQILLLMMFYQLGEIKKIMIKTIEEEK